MKATQINEYGGEDVIKLTNDASKPQPGDGQVLVEVKAAAVNPFDIKVRDGQVKEFIPLTFPATLGGDFAGIVSDANGQGGLKEGDEVYGQAQFSSSHGAFGEFALVKAETLAPKPKSVDFLTTAALPLAGVSAYQALVEHADLKSGQKILIHGGAGGIGSFAIQLAKHIGAYVATTAATDDTEFVKSLGADEVIDYKTQDFSQVLKDLDVVFDTVGGETYTKSFEVLKDGGTIVSMLEQPNEELAGKHQIKAIHQATEVNKERLTKLTELVEQGTIKVQVDKVFPLEETAEAMEYLKAGKHRGKVVIKIA